MFKKNTKVKFLNNIIALCGTSGISKKYDWKLYKEEIELKTSESSLLLKPLFVIIAISKYLIKRTLF